ASRRSRRFAGRARRPPGVTPCRRPAAPRRQELDGARPWRPPERRRASLRAGARRRAGYSNSYTGSLCHLFGWGGEIRKTLARRLQRALAVLFGADADHVVEVGD